MTEVVTSASLMQTLKLNKEKKPTVSDKHWEKHMSERHNSVATACLSSDRAKASTSASVEWQNYDTHADISNIPFVVWSPRRLLMPKHVWYHRADDASDNKSKARHCRPFCQAINTHTGLPCKIIVNTICIVEQAYNKTLPCFQGLMQQSNLLLQCPGTYWPRSLLKNS